MVNYRAGAPTMSPNGVHILYSSPRTGNGDIYRVTVRGTESVRLTDSPSFEGDPSYSPDGQYVAYVHDDENGCTIWLMHADGTGRRQLTTPEGGCTDSNPRFSTDGKGLYFIRSRPGGGLLDVKELHLIALESSRDGESEMLFSSTASWLSMNDNRILYSPKRAEIVVASLNGSTKRRIADGYCPQYSSDGKKVVFVTGYPKHDLVIMNSDGTDRRLIPAPIGDKGPPTFSSDGSELIVVIGGERGVGTIYLISIESGEARRITDTR